MSPPTRFDIYTVIIRVVIQTHTRRANSVKDVSRDKIQHCLLKPLKYLRYKLINKDFTVLDVCERS